MTMKNAQIVLVAATLMGVAGAAAGQTEELVRTIPMEPGGRFTLRNVEGEITVTGVDGDDLTIRATKRASRRGGDDDALDRVEIEIEERNNQVIVETDYPGHRRSFLESLGDLLGGGRRERLVAVDYRVAMPRAPAVAVINETLARQHWPNADPIARRVTVQHRGTGVRGDFESVRRGA